MKVVLIRHGKVNFRWKSWYTSDQFDEACVLYDKLYKSLDKLEALIQHNESPIDTWSENEYELNKTYAFDTVAFSEWLTDLRKAILDDTLEKIDSEGQNV